MRIWTAKQLMEMDERQDFLMSRVRHPTSEAAVFMENRVIVTKQQTPVYVESMNRFASVEEARKQEQIR